MRCARSASGPKGPTRPLGHPTRMLPARRRRSARPCGAPRRVVRGAPSSSLATAPTSARTKLGTGTTGCTARTRRPPGRPRGSSRHAPAARCRPGARADRAGNGERWTSHACSTSSTISTSAATLHSFWIEGTHHAVHERVDLHPLHRVMVPEPGLDLLREHRGSSGESERSSMWARPAVTHRWRLLGHLGITLAGVQGSMTEPRPRDPGGPRLAMTLRVAFECRAGPKGTQPDLHRLFTGSLLEWPSGFAEAPTLTRTRTGLGEAMEGLLTKLLVEALLVVAQLGLRVARPAVAGRRRRARRPDRA